MKKKLTKDVLTLLESKERGKKIRAANKIRGKKVVSNTYFTLAFSYPFLYRYKGKIVRAKELPARTKLDTTFVSKSLFDFSKMFLKMKHENFEGLDVASLAVIVRDTITAISILGKTNQLPSDQIEIELNKRYALLEHLGVERKDAEKQVKRSLF